MHQEPASKDSFEISQRFREVIEARIARLEKDADWDERMLESLTDEDHRRRHRRLVAAQRGESLRMRVFLDRMRIREPRPAIAL